MQDKTGDDIIRKYLDSLPEHVRRPLSDVIGAILEAAPAAEAKMNYGILAFALVPGGKRDEQVMAAGYENHIGFYPHPTAIARFENQLNEKYKYAKGSVQFPLSGPMPLDLIIRMVRYRKGLIEGGYPVL